MKRRSDLACLAFSALAAALAHAGAAWRHMQVTEPEPVYGLAGRGDTLWAAVDGGVRRSGDRGATWSEIGEGMKPGKAGGVAAGRKVLAACQGKLLYLSGDGGRTWAPKESLALGSFVRMDAWSDTLFAWRSLYSDPSPQPEAYRFSADDGATWQDGGFAGPAMPEPRIFRGDTLAFAGGTLLRVNSDGPRDASAFQFAIFEAVAAGDRLFLLTEGGILVAEEATGPWSQIATGKIEPDVRDLAIDSDRIPIRTMQGISLSLDHGSHWEFLRANFDYHVAGRLHLSGGYLYNVPDFSPTARRYSIPRKTWDTLTLPVRDGRRFLFAAGADRLALGKFEEVHPPLWVSLDQGVTFQPKGLLPETLQTAISNDQAQMALNGNAMAIATFAKSWLSRDGGATWNPATASTGSCPLTSSSGRLALMDSGIFLADNQGGLWRATGNGPQCGWTSFASPASAYPGNYMSLRGSGGSLYLSGSGGIWVWEETRGDAVKPGIRPRAARIGKGRFPVQVWRRSAGGRPAPGEFDAKGALRR